MSKYITSAIESLLIALRDENRLTQNDVQELTTALRSKLIPLKPQPEKKSYKFGIEAPKFVNKEVEVQSVTKLYRGIKKWMKQKK